VHSELQSERKLKQAMAAPRAKDLFSSRLRTKLQLVIPIPFETGATRNRGKSLANDFRDYLLTLHSVIRASVPLMEAAEMNCLRLENDELQSALAKYYHRHAREEAHHDEWLLDDLEVIGVAREEVLSRKPSVAVAELVGSQYYWIHHWHPVCLLGYISFMEGYPPRRRQIDAWIVQTGYPETAFRTLAKHSYLDPYHRKALYATMDSLPLGEDHKEWITLNAIYTAEKWSEVLDSFQPSGAIR